MAKTFTSADVLRAQVWLKLFFSYVKGSSSSNTYDEYQAAKDVYDEILHGNWDPYYQLDNAFEVLAKDAEVHQYELLRGYEYTANDLAECIAYMCAVNKICWDDRIRSEEEKKQFQKTLLGGALYRFGCWSTQKGDEFQIVADEPEQEPTQPTQQAPNQGTPTQNQGTPTQPQNQAPQQTQPTQQATQPTQSQPQQADTTQSATADAITADNTTNTANTAKSGTPAQATALKSKGNTLSLLNANGLASKEKTKLSNEVYCLIGVFKKTSGNKPKAHVKPRAKLNGKGNLDVHFTSGQGYEDCLLYFATEDDARKFYNDVANDPDTKALLDKADIDTMAVKKAAADPNGYFEVKTNVGTTDGVKTYILAKKLNEDLEESLEDKPEMTAEEYSKYMEELSENFHKFFLN